MLKQLIFSLSLIIPTPNQTYANQDINTNFITTKDMALNPNNNWYQFGTVNNISDYYINFFTLKIVNKDVISIKICIFTKTKVTEEKWYYSLDKNNMVIQKVANKTIFLRKNGEILSKSNKATNWEKVHINTPEYDVIVLIQKVIKEYRKLNDTSSTLKV